MSAALPLWAPLGAGPAARPEATRRGAPGDERPRPLRGPHAATHVGAHEDPLPGGREVPPPGPLAPLTWPAARLGEALDRVAARLGLRGGGAGAGAAPEAEAVTAADARRSLVAAAARRGLEAVDVDATVPELDGLLARAAPALLPLAAASPDGGFLVLLGRRGARLRLLAPDLRVRECPAQAVHDALCQARVAPLRPEVDALLATAAVAPAAAPAVRAALLRERLASERVGPAWLLRLPAGAGLRAQAAQARLPQRLGLALLAFAVLYALEIAGWALVGRAVLEGRLDTGWLAAWVLLLFSLVPLRAAGQWLQGSLALEAGRLLKTRLLAGALRMDLQQVRRLGVGQWLGRVIESQALESLALNGGLATGVALLELGFAAWILAQGAAPGPHLLLLALWGALTLLLAARHARRLGAWTSLRLDMTHDLVERMLGHRTRLAQERPARRDAGEDASLQAYLAASREMDAAALPAYAGAPAAWPALALAALGPAFLEGGPGLTGALAISLGGLLFAQRAFSGLTGGLTALARAAIAWRQVRGLFGVAGEAGKAGTAGAPVAPPGWAPPGAEGAAAATPVLDAAGLIARHAAQGEAVLRGASLQIGHGERVLLQGASGAGKSTLAALLAGLRPPEAGLLLLGGWDRATLGEDWQRGAAAAPQFHENHVLSGTLAFNLLLGREGPPSLADLAEAEALCHELGLGELLARMPSGLHQRVGETGWQLSHGERSRVFLARALLQRAPLTVLDESFAALDPPTLATCLRTTLARTDALLVIAHP